MTDAPAFDRMRDHWWWRPGWKLGRSFYAWHITFDDAPDLHRLAAEYADALSVPGLDIIPPKWLHLTMQGVGFTDEVSTADADAIAEAAGRHLAELEPFEVVLDATVIEPEVVRLDVEPAARVAEVRLAVRAGIADVWGTDGVPEPEDDFIPHVSLAYSSAEGPFDVIARAVRSVKVAPARTTIRHADLIVLNRDSKQYQWMTYAAVPFGRRQTT